MIEAGKQNLEAEKVSGEADAASHEAPAAAPSPTSQFSTSGRLPAVVTGAGAAPNPTASDRAYGHADAATVVKPAALRAVSRVIEEQRSSPATQRPDAAEQGGHALGVALGVVVTEALAAVPSWNAPVVDAQGQQVEQVPGATRIGDYPILKRHEEVVGPQVTAAVDKMSPGVLHDLLAGVGVGATEAPGDSYRLEAHIADLIRRYFGK